MKYASLTSLVSLMQQVEVVNTFLSKIWSESVQVYRGPPMVHFIKEVHIMSYICYFDGAYEPVNPGGTASYGAVIHHNKERVWECSEGYLPR